ncbi:MAG: hypothetical protein ACJAZO_005364 [Myxococcota bacterium]|jgi:hypothetical protein
MASLVFLPPLDALTDVVAAFLNPVLAGTEGLWSPETWMVQGEGRASGFTELGRVLDCHGFPVVKVVWVSQGEGIGRQQANPGSSLWCSQYAYDEAGRWMRG